MIKICLFLLLVASPLFSQQVYNYIGKPVSKMTIPNSAIIKKYGNEVVYSWFNRLGFYTFIAKNDVIRKSRRDMLVPTKNEAYQVWGECSEQLMGDGFYPLKTDIGDAVFENSRGISAAVWIEWNEEQLMYAVIASFE